MDLTVIVAIIAAIGSSVVAIISSILTLVSNRKAAQYEKDLEEHKHRLEAYYKSNDMGQSAVEERAQVLGDACSGIQRLRDNIRRLLGSPKPSEQLVQETQDICMEFRDLYAESHYSVPAFERAVLHDVKNIALDVNIMCDLYRATGKEFNETRLGGYVESLHKVQEALIREHQKWQALLHSVIKERVLALGDFPYLQLLEDLPPPRDE